MGEQALPALGSDKSRAGSSSSSLTRQGCRYRRQDRVEEGWKPSLFNMARMPDISQRDEDVTSS